MNPRDWPPAVRFMALHAAIGFGIGTLFVGALLALDVGGLATLMWREEGVIALGMLWFFSGLTFGSAQIGGSVMLLGHGEDGPRGGRRAPAVPRTAPVRISRRSSWPSPLPVRPGGRRA